MEFLDGATLKHIITGQPRTVLESGRRICRRDHPARSKRRLDFVGPKSSAWLEGHKWRDYGTRGTVLVFLVAKLCETALPPTEVLDESVFDVVVQKLKN